MPYKQVTGIYIIKNLINKKIYIGSAKSIFNRLKTHKWQLLNNKHFNKHLQSSFNKYGLSNFTFELLEIVELNKNLLQEREEYYIQLYKSNDRLFGYNKRITCDTNLGKKLSPEHIEKLKQSHLGIKRSIEAQIKISKSQYKEVYKIDESKKIICKYASIQEAGYKNNINPNSVSACCRNILNSTGGFYWCFVEDYENKVFKGINTKNSKKHKKYIYENIETGEIYYKLIDVANILCIGNTTLHHMFSGKNKNKTKFIRYEENINIFG